VATRLAAPNWHLPQQQDIGRGASVDAVSCPVSGVRCRNRSWMTHLMNASTIPSPVAR
jgi:hypothetical protein